MHKRRKARELAIQVLYSLVKNPRPMEDVLGDPLFANAGKPHKDFATTLVLGCAEHKEEINGIIQKLSMNWKLSRIAVMDHVILWMALFEMIYLDDIPAAVSINEAIDLSKKYSTEDSGRFINGILDHYHKTKCT